MQERESTYLHENQEQIKPINVTRMVSPSMMRSRKVPGLSICLTLGLTLQSWMYNGRRKLFNGSAAFGASMNFKPDSRNNSFLEIYPVPVHLVHSGIQLPELQDITKIAWQLLFPTLTSTVKGIFKMQPPSWTLFIFLQSWNWMILKNKASVITHCSLICWPDQKKQGWHGMEFPPICWKPTELSIAADFILRMAKRNTMIMKPITTNKRMRSFSIGCWINKPAIIWISGPI